MSRLPETAFPGRRRAVAVRPGGIAIGVLAVWSALSLWSGCTAASRVSPVAPAAAAAHPTAPVPAPSAVVPSAAVPAPPLPPAPTAVPSAGEVPRVSDQVTMLVESVPAGATIVVDGRPVGKAPLHLDVPATVLGFFRDYLEIRARFIAETESEVSHTAIEEFTPREKVPAVLRFTPAGARRVAR